MIKHEKRGLIYQGWEWVIGENPGQTVDYMCLEVADVSESDLKNLAAMKQLRRLRLSNTPISDAGLVHLEGLPKLETLNLYGTNVTKVGISKLQAALPNCVIRSSLDDDKDTDSK